MSTFDEKPTFEENKSTPSENDTIEDHRIINSLSEGVQKMKILHSSFLEYKKFQTRIHRHGNPDTVLKCGRKKVSDEHKKETYRRTLERKREARRAKALAEGRIPQTKGRPTKGRPTKNIISEDHVILETEP